jgi:two-component system chemotaxis response regulator CheY
MLDLQNLKILIVDDHFLARRAIADALHDINVTNISEVQDGFAARDILRGAHERGEPFDVVYLDWNIPHMDGIEVLQQFRTMPEFQTTAFIMFTSAAEQSDVLKAIKAGAAGYLIKPVSRQAIIQKLKDAMDWIEQKKLAPQDVSDLA